ncbi:MAG TPA: hypothetical protein VE666_03890 [Mycobacterium sp.]|nr:hypothetical protein [Mycobacterium sp.]
MTDMATTYRPDDESREVLVTSHGASTEPQALIASQQSASEPHTVITEQQVLLSTTAAVALPPATTRRWRDAVHAITAALRAVFAASEKPPARRHYPKRHAWLDNARMSREMDRL